MIIENDDGSTTVFRGGRAIVRPAESGPIKFTIHRYADVSTAYLEASDLSLISDATITGHVAETDNKAGCYWYAAEDGEVFTSQVAEWKKAGLSDRFVTIMTELRSQGIDYIRFDADGGEVDGLEHET